MISKISWTLQDFLRGDTIIQDLNTHVLSDKNESMTQKKEREKKRLNLRVGIERIEGVDIGGVIM